MAVKSNLITSDKDFGEHVFRKGLIPAGVILIRSVSERSSGKIRLIERLMKRDLKLKRKVTSSFEAMGTTYKVN